MFSIVMPVRNRPTYVVRALQSLAAQSFKEAEVIIIDDGSTEELNSIANNFANLVVTYVKLPRMGAAIARNVGIGLARFNWIAFLDSDDWWPPNKLSRVAQFLKLNPKADFVYSGFTFWNETDNSGGRCVIEPPGDNIHRELLVRNPVHALPSVVVRKSCLLDVDGFDVQFLARQDIDLYVRLFDRVKVLFIPESLCFVSMNAEHKLSNKPFNRLQGSILFYKKHKKRMTWRERSHNCKRIVSYGLQCRDVHAVARYALSAVPAILFKQVTA